MAAGTAQLTRYSLKPLTKHPPPIKDRGFYRGGSTCQTTSFQSFVFAGGW